MNTPTLIAGREAILEFFFAAETSIVAQIDYPNARFAVGFLITI